MGRGPSIEGRKNAADAQKAKLFTKLIREITVAARTGGGDPAGNPRLRIAIDKALNANMTKDTVERAIKRGSGEDGGAELLHEVRYEGYGPGGVAVMVDCMTDNPTRTVADVRHAFSKFGGNLGTSGSVAFQFTETGQIWLDTRSPGQGDRILEVALEAGAEDVVDEGEFTEVLTTHASFEAVKKALSAAGFKPVEAEIVMRAANRVAVSGEAAEALRKLLDRLDELDDVQNVHHNADFPQEQ
jgi:YebC/PmpR family DNA-binding regulatory protein